MQRDEMIRFASWLLRSHAPAREWGGVRFEAEEIVDEYLREREA